MPKHRLDDIFDLPSPKRRKLRLPTKGRTRRDKSVSTFTRDQLVEYMKTRDIKSTRVLMKIRHETDPVVYDYLKEFGSWEKAKEAVFGPDVSKPPTDAKYMAQLLNEFNIRTETEYRAAHIARPSVFPSFHYVLKEWGRFSNLKFAANRLSLKHSCEKYMILWRKLGGKPPNARMCEENGIEVDRLIGFFGSRNELNSFISEIEGVSEAVEKRFSLKGDKA